MNNLRAAAQQALEALEKLVVGTEYEEAVEAERAIDALKAALEEPVQEPVAWIQPDHLQKARKAPFLCRVEPTKRMVDFVALYTAPPQRKPLTEEEIIDLWAGASDPESPDISMIDFARAIERAHGIT